MQLIEAKNLVVKYGSFDALRNVSFEISTGEIVTIVGPNGSGKTSFLRAIIGAVVPKSGTIHLKPGIKFGYVPQRLNIDPTLPISVERFMRLTGNFKKDVCRQALSRVCLLYTSPSPRDGLLSRMPSSA